jgi:hypothetical protein
MLRSHDARIWLLDGQQTLDELIPMVSLSGHFAAAIVAPESLGAIWA